jgi:hypothetical protein
MADSSAWENYAVKNERLGWGDSNEADRLFHQQEQRKAEDMARKEREYEQRKREEEDRRRGC